MFKINHSLALLAIAPIALLTTSACHDFMDDMPVGTTGFPNGHPTTGGNASSASTHRSDHSSDTSSRPNTNTSAEGKSCADPNNPDTPQIIVSGDLVGKHHWTCDKIYVLDQDAKVTVKSGVLAIDAGTTIKGKAGSALIIEKDAQLVANGTAEKPIVFTSHQPIGKRVRGDWGGLVFLGRAVPTKVSTFTRRALRSPTPTEEKTPTTTAAPFSMYGSNGPATVLPRVTNSTASPFSHAEKQPKSTTFSPTWASMTASSGSAAVSMHPTSL